MKDNLLYETSGDKILKTHGFSMTYCKVYVQKRFQKQIIKFSIKNYFSRVLYNHHLQKYFLQLKWNITLKYRLIGG